MNKQGNQHVSRKRTHASRRKPPTTGFDVVVQLTSSARCRHKSI